MMPSVSHAQTLLGKRNVYLATHFKNKSVQRNDNPLTSGLFSPHTKMPLGYIFAA